MKVLWLCSLPAQIYEEGLGRRDGAGHPASWIVGHLPPPPGLELHLACPDPAGRGGQAFDYRGARVHLVPCPPLGRAATLFAFEPWRYRRVVAAVQPDLIHGWGTEDSHVLSAIRLAPRRHLAGIQGVMTEINRRRVADLRYRLVAWIERATLRQARYAAAESAFIGERVRALGCRGAIAVVQQPLRAEFLRAEPANGFAPAVLFVGSFLSNKGYADAVAAFAAAAPRPWELVMIGSGADGDLARLRAVARAQGVADRLRRLSTQTPGQIVGHMQAASVFLLPTRFDSGPTALKEALAMGLWPVCYDTSGPGEFLRRLDSGTRVPDGDVAALGAALRDVLDRRPWSDRARMARQVAAARQLFGPETAWTQLTDLYQRIVKENP